MYVCYCNKVTEEDIRNAIVINGARTVKEVISITGAMQNSNCAVNNPKGVCCYSDIVKTFNKYKNENLRRNFIMKKMSIYEPALCCDTGICGVNVDTELLRISTVINTLKKNGVAIDRFNLNNAPMAFVNNKVINNFINEKGVDGLPAVMLDDEIIITGRYPSNEEIISYLEIPESYLKESKPAKKSSCCCSDDKCC